MKTLQDCKNRIAETFGYEFFNKLINDLIEQGHNETILTIMNELPKIYAQSAIDEIKEKIVEEATCSPIPYHTHSYRVDPESIRSVTIELK